MSLPQFTLAYLNLPLFTIVYLSLIKSNLITWDFPKITPRYHWHYLKIIPKLLPRSLRDYPDIMILPLDYPKITLQACH